MLIILKNIHIHIKIEFKHIADDSSYIGIKAFLLSNPFILQIRTAGQRLTLQDSSVAQIGFIKFLD